MSYKDWDYWQARRELWPEKKSRNWRPGQKPSVSKPIDDEIATLIANKKAPNIAALSDYKVLGSKTFHAFIFELVGGFDPFCPYRETRAHWIPFALQFAHTTSEEHKLRCELRVHDRDKALNDWTKFQKIARAIQKYTAASLSPDYARPSRDYRDAKHTLNYEHVDEVLSAINKAERFASELITMINGSGKQQKTPYINSSQWEIGFATIMCMAWRRLTDRVPKANNPVITFVQQAFASCTDAERDWSNPVEVACDLYRKRWQDADENQIYNGLSHIWEPIYKHLPEERATMDGPAPPRSSLQNALITIRRDDPAFRKRVLAQGQSIVRESTTQQLKDVMEALEPEFKEKLAERERREAEKGKK